MRRRLFVTTALPYANGPFHIGHIMEYIQADIWVRFQRMQGHEVHFIGADDAHGAPIMLAAEKAGKSPEQFIAEIAKGRKQYLDGFHIEFDNWHSTHSKENTELSQDIYRKLDKAGLVYKKAVEQFFDPVKGMYLADRDISRDPPYFGIRIPDIKEEKYLYVWLDAPIGYLASLKDYFDSGKAKAKGETRSFTEYLAADSTEMIHFIGKDIIYFHTLFWPVMLKYSGYKIPDHVYVHGFITVSGDKMSKSRGTGIDPLSYLKLGMNPEWF